jgi:hypothetical protein
MGGATIEGAVPSGIGFMVTSSGGGKDAGVYETNASYYITGPNGVIDNSWFPNVTVKKGSVTITPAPITFDLRYGTYTKGDPWVRPYPACSAGTADSGSPYTFNLTNGETATLSVGADPAPDGDPGTYTISHSVSFSSSASNYSVSYTNDTLTIVSPGIRFNLGGRTLDYNENVQDFDKNGVTGTYTNGSNSGASVAIEKYTAVVGNAVYHCTLNDGGTFTLTVTGSGKDPGTYPITYSVSEKTGSASYYTFSATNDVLTIVSPEPVNTDGSYNPDDPPHGYHPDT